MACDYFCSDVTSLQAAQAKVRIIIKKKVEAVIEGGPEQDLRDGIALTVWSAINGKTVKTLYGCKVQLSWVEDACDEYRGQPAGQTIMMPLNAASFQSHHNTA